LKDILPEGIIEFRCFSQLVENRSEEETADSEDEEQGKKKDRDGMKLIAIDNSQTMLVHWKLDARHFSEFVCKKKRQFLGFNFNNFYKLIKSIGKNDVLTLYVDHDNKNYLKIKIENKEEKKKSILSLKLLDLDEQKLKIPEIEFEAIITINSQEFHKLCREMSQIGDYIEIRCLVNKVSFACKGDNSDRITEYTVDDDETDLLISIKHAGSDSKDAPQIVQGIYELKNLVLFGKCSSLCSEIEIYMKNSNFLVIKYPIASLGKILLCLVPVNEEMIKNSTFSDEEENYKD